MKNYYNVSFEYSESVYCSNIAHAETAEDVERYYSEKYNWVKVTEASEHDVKNALERGKPVIEVEHIETAEETETAEEVTVKTVNPVLDTLEVLDRVQTALDTRKDRSAWDKGVTVYASELLEFATKRDVNGNRYYLGINYENKTFSRERGMWYSKEDIIEIKKSDRRKLIDKLENMGFSEIEHF